MRITIEYTVKGDEFIEVMKYDEYDKILALIETLKRNGAGKRLHLYRGVQVVNVLIPYTQLRNARKAIADMEIAILDMDEKQGAAILQTFATLAHAYIDQTVMLVMRQIDVTPNDGDINEIDCPELADAQLNLVVRGLDGAA